MKLFKNLFFCFLLLFCFSCTQRSKNKKYDLIKDNVGVLSKQENDCLNTLLNNYYDSTGKQFIIYIVNSVGKNTTVEDYTDKFIRKIDFGSVGFSESLVMIIFIQNQSTQLRWGRNYNDKINDSIGSSIINEVNIDFSINHFFSGIEKCIMRIKNIK